ncbi:MAG: diaminopimelate decarboxylase, partial [Muribaculaceae bacterium]|nr:diaminopimelate decarboxylase [Muribaculaceae bacterium]
MYQFPLDKLSEIPTPYYYYDMALLRSTLDAVNKEIKGFPFKVHYAIKANGNDVILREIASHGFGADLVSGGELVAALAAGFKAQDLAFSGVGKTDWEISLGVENDIFSFNVESVPELEVINEIAGGLRKKAGVVLRVNPDIDAHTHRYITTGTAHDKFGISLEMLPQVIQMAHNLPNIHLRGLHFHIGSQITMMRPYEMLCEKINELQDSLERMGVSLEIINVGGGLGVDYDAPDEHPLAGFTSYFNVFKRGLKLRQGQEVHFELGRSIMAQCGTLISRVVFVKSNRDKKFVILDAGMTDLIRPA